MVSRALRLSVSEAPDVCAVHEKHERHEKMDGVVGAGAQACYPKATVERIVP